MLIVREAASITQPPESRIVCSGETVTFSVTAAGTGPLHYEWLKDGSPISGAPDAAAYTIAAAASNHAGAYSVRVTGACGPAVLSQAAELAINQKPTVTSDTAVSLFVDVAGTCPSMGNDLVLTATDPEGDVLHWRVKPGTEPTLGTVVFSNGDSGGQVTMCFLPNGEEGMESLLIEVRDDCGGSSEVTVDIMTMPFPRVTGWQTIQTHGSAGTLAIALDPSKTNADTGRQGPVSEPRLAGIRHIRAMFSEEVKAADGVLDLNDVAVTGWDGVNPAAYYQPSRVTLSDGDRSLEIYFDPSSGQISPLSNQMRYTFELAGRLVGKWTDLPIAGDTNCQVRALVGDANNDGSVNLIDVGIVKAKVNTPVTSAVARYDLNLDGAINLIDLGLAKSRAGSAAP
jgi:hypothetical protein